MDKIRIGVDLHGVIDDNLNLFKNLSIILMMCCESMDLDVEIYIISGPPKENVIQELDKLGLVRSVHYSEVYTVVDFLKSEGVEMWLDHKNTWWASDEDWWGAKAKLCRSLGVDIMIDNTYKYQPYFKDSRTKFVLYNKFRK